MSDVDKSSIKRSGRTERRESVAREQARSVLRSCGNMLSRGEQIADVSTRVGLGNLGRIYAKWEWRVVAPTTIPAGLIDSINAVVSAP